MKWILVFTMILACFSVGFAQQQNQISFTNKRDSSVLKWITTSSHDFGKIKLNKPASFSFKFINISDNPLVIIKVKASCSCTIPDYTKEQIMPGETGTIKVTFISNTSGIFEKTIKVTMEKNRTFLLRITGEVVQ